MYDQNDTFPLACNLIFLALAIAILQSENNLLLKLQTNITKKLFHFLLKASCEMAPLNPGNLLSQMPFSLVGERANGCFEIEDISSRSEGH